MWQIKWTNVSDHSRNFFYFHVKSWNYNYTKSKLFILIKSYILIPDLLAVTQNHYHPPDTQVSVIKIYRNQRRSGIWDCHKHLRWNALQQRLMTKIFYLLLKIPHVRCLRDPGLDTSLGIVKIVVSKVWPLKLKE